jgi:hypothetical protein
MKNILSFILFIGLSLIPMVTFAGLGIPFGGRILLTHQPPNVECPADPTGSPFTIKPVGVALPSPYSANYAGLVHVGLITSGAWILGLYYPSSDCTAVGGPTGGEQFPTKETNFFGTSTNIP